MMWLNTMYKPGQVGTPNMGMFFNPTLYIVNLVQSDQVGINPICGLTVHTEIDLECRGARFGGSGGITSL